MIGVLFWNAGITEKGIGQNPDKIYRIEEILTELVVENNCDIAILVEYPVPTESLCNQLSLFGKDFFERRVNKKTRVKFIADRFLMSETVFDDSPYYTIHDFQMNDAHFLIGGVHFPSKLHAGHREADSVGIELIRSVQEAEKTAGHENMIIAGDFNANPFEDVMVCSHLLHALPSAAIVEQKQYRTVLGKESQMFYNPMWNLMGDSHSPMGSYYSNSGSAFCLYWNHFDQVIISSSFIRAYQRDSLKIITKTSRHTLADSAGRPDGKTYSDHFPICFSFREDFL